MNRWRQVGAAEKITSALSKPDTSGIDDLEGLEKLITDTVGRHFDAAYRRSPLITAVVIGAWARRAGPPR